ncbi:hypothetical protein JJJ17_13920 [Paracoccus caeni]|uniref:Uncharacterized protein n=1 Tax=Paracoccus caeni TaxID=657651 RepID=A0A934SGJ4_9RHOB|nr:hypothetical protein [Paracoccus caeni]MBK4217029.1 hypothetical protein [Paracoccus caeni]
MKATHDDKTFTLARRYRSRIYPLEELPEQPAFYRMLREEYPKSGKTYDETIAEFERPTKIMSRG